MTPSLPDAEAGQYQQVKIRLAEIEAPEKGPSLRSALPASLAAMCFGRIATINTQEKDRYGRSVARVECGGQDANAEQVRRGMAWAYTKYQRDLEMPRLEEAARRERVGLWADREPMAPWEWRQSQRKL